VSGQDSEIDAVIERYITRVHVNRIIFERNGS
jgi:hypothetical protein